MTTEVDGQRVAIAAARMIRSAIVEASMAGDAAEAIKRAVEALDAGVWFLMASDEAHTPGEREAIKVEVERLRDVLCLAAVESTVESVRCFLTQRAAQLEAFDRAE